MSRGKITFCDILRKFKNKIGVNNDCKVAELLELKQTALAQRKKRKSIPYEELILYCQKNAVSLDELFSVKKTEALDFLNDEERKYASMTVEALRNNKTILAVKTNLDALAGIPNDTESSFSQPLISNGANQILRLEKERPKVRMLQLAEKNIASTLDH